MSSPLIVRARLFTCSTLLTLFGLILLGCHTNTRLSEITQPNAAQAEEAAVMTKPTFIPHGDNPCHSQGLALLLHGLNNHRGVMGPISELIASRGFATRAITLAGHEAEDVRNTPPASVTSWRDQVDTFLKIVPEHCSNQKVLLVGYSTGALLWIDALERAKREGRSMPENLSLLLLAPPFALRPIIRVASIFASPLLLLSPLGLSIPTRVPEDARASEFISFELFRSFLKLYGLVRNRERQEPLPKVPTLVLTHQDDELVDSTGVSSYVQCYGSNSWEVQVLKGPAPPNSYLHLFVLPEHAGSEVWERVKEEVGRFVVGGVR